MSVLWIVIGIVIGLVLAGWLRTGKPITFTPSDRPTQGNATMADVENLLKKGDKIGAIRCYREIHGVGLKEAKDAVEQLPSYK